MTPPGDSTEPLRVGYLRVHHHNMGPRATEAPDTLNGREKLTGWTPWSERAGKIARSKLKCPTQTRLISTAKQLKFEEKGRATTVSKTICVERGVRVRLDSTRLTSEGQKSEVGSHLVRVQLCFS